MKNQLVYLDNAATSFPKPRSVIREVANCLENYCGNAGRSSHKLSLLAANKLYECREQISILLNVPTPENIAFVPSCTYGLNLIIKGILRQGDHVLISDMEHNSVYRPICNLASKGIISYDTFSAISKPNQTEDELIKEIEDKIKKNTRLLICNHQSNITSYSLPIDKIGELCKKFHILFALDVAQSVGHYNIDIQKANIDFLSAPGHKGLYSPQGSAFVVVNSSHPLETLIEGGNGIFSLDPKMPPFSPERYEVGTLPIPAISGLCEGIKQVRDYGIDLIFEHEKSLFSYLRDGLLNIPRTTVYLPDHKGNTLSFSIDSISTELICSTLNDENICVRGGFHCSALAHKSLNTQSKGTVRVSFGIFNNKLEIDRLLSVCNRLVAQNKS